MDTKENNADIEKLLKTYQNRIIATILDRSRNTATTESGGKNEENKNKFNYCKMNNHEEKYCYRRKKAKTKDAKNVTEEIIYDKLFIVKELNQKCDSETFIADSDAMSHMVTPEENMTNLCYDRKQVTVGYSGTITGTNRGNWNGYQKCDGKLHHMMLFDTAVVPGLHKILFNMTQALQK